MITVLDPDLTFSISLHIADNPELFTEEQVEELGYLFLTRKTKVQEALPKICRWMKEKLPEWSLQTAQEYPEEFNSLARLWLLMVGRLQPQLPKDLRLLVLKYIAREWRKE